MTINEDKTSVSYNPGGLRFLDLDIQDFEYVATVSPSSSFGKKNASAQLNFRLTPNIKLSHKCEEMRKLRNKSIPTTTERLVLTLSFLYDNRKVSINIIFLIRLIF